MNANEFRKLTVDKRRNKLIEYAYNYYQGEPQISDPLFDRLYREFREDGGEDLGVAFGYAPVGLAVCHFCTPIGSLPSKMKAGEITQMLPEDADIQVMPKLDGGSVVCYYENGKLKTIVSRGDGEDGIDVTQNMRHAVPVKIPVKGNVAVRAEAVLTWEDFENLEGSHPRNKAVGLSQSVHVDQEEVKLLRVVAYSILTSSKSRSKDWGTLKDWGFTIPSCQFMKYSNFIRCIERKDPLFFDAESSFFKLGDGHRIPNDGLVISLLTKSPVSKRFADWDYFTSDAFAFKFEDEEAETTITNIEWRLSRTGRIVPRGEVKTVNLDGANINFVSLNHLQWVTANELGIGARVIMIRANKVIPYIKETIEGSIDYRVPEKCPECGGDVAVDGVDLRCMNDNCQRGTGQIIYNVFDLCSPKGLSKATLTNFINHYHFESIDDLIGRVPKIKKSDLIKQFGDHYGELLSQTVEYIRSPKDLKMEDVIRMANIPAVGKGTSKRIGKCLPAEEIIMLMTTGMTEPFQQYTSSSKGFEALNANLDTLKKLFLLFKNAEWKKVSNGDDIAVRYCMTGSLSKTKKKLEVEFASYGAEFVSIGSADVLICNGSSSSSKYKAAEKKGIPIVSEQEFRRTYAI